MNRSDFQQLAAMRTAEAKVLLDSRHFAGAYYLTGYAVECAIKACFAARTREFDFPPEPAVFRQLYTHDLTLLLKTAELVQPLQDELSINPKLEDSWGTVKDWNEKTRYKVLIDETAAIDLYNAVADPKDGVLTWLSRLW